MIPVSEDINCYKNIFELNTPFVFVERKLEGTNCNSVITHSYDSISQIIDHLVDLGHKKIAYIGREKDLLHHKIRFSSFADSMKGHNLNLKDEYVIYGTNYRFRDGYEDMSKLLELENKPTAVLVFNDVLAIGAMQAIKDKGYKIPGDFSVIGFDNIEISNYTEPPLTSVTTMKEQISKVAFDLLINKINKKSTKKKHVFIKTEVVMRKSTGPVKQ